MLWKKKIKESIKYVKGLEARMRNLDQCIQQVGGIEIAVQLHLDVSTKWNSTYMMLVNALKYKRAFANLLLNDRNYKYCPSSEE